MSLNEVFFFYSKKMNFIAQEADQQEMCNF